MRTIISKMTHPYLMIHQCCKVKGSINNSIIWPLFKTFKANNSPRSFIKAFCNTLKVDIAESEGTRKIFTTLYLQNHMSVFKSLLLYSTRCTCNVVKMWSGYLGRLQTTQCKVNINITFLFPHIKPIVYFVNSNIGWNKNNNEGKFC